MRIQEDARRIATAHYYLLLAPSGLGVPRLGLIVTRKIGNAVVRNRIKRVVRECFRHAAGLFPPGIDVVVIARPGAEALAPSEACAEWEKVRGLVEKRARQALAQTGDKAHVPSRRAAPRAR